MNATMNAIDLLTRQHDEVDKLLETLQHAENAATKRATFVRLADSLAAHMAIEENIFYPAVIAKKLDDQLHEAVEEHLAAKRLVVDLLSLAVGDDQFDAKVSVLEEELEHHNHEEEEDKLFPAVKKMLTADELTALGSEMLAMFETLMAGSPRDTLPGQAKHAAALPAV